MHYICESSIPILKDELLPTVGESGVEQQMQTSRHKQSSLSCCITLRRLSLLNFLTFSSHAPFNKHHRRGEMFRGEHMAL